MKKEPNYDIFSRYVNNQTTEEENKLIDSWYTQYLRDTSARQEEIDWERATNRIKRLNQSNIRPFIYSSYLKVASVFLVFISVIFLVYKIKSNSFQFEPLENIYAHRSDGYVQKGGVKVPLPMEDSILTITDIYLHNLDLQSKDSFSDTIIIKGPSGQNFLVLLPDSSEIMLNSQSEIHLPSSFSKVNRSVSLYGEAKFKIKKRDGGKSKFEVKFADHKIEVLGTEFSIQSYNNLSEIHVALLSGQVKLTNSFASSILLKKGDNYIYNKTNNQYSVNTDLKENEKNIAWVNQDFQFDHTPFVEMCAILSDWYEFDIQLGESIQGEDTFTGILSRSKNLGDVLDIININNQYQYNINMKERRIVIDRK